MPLIRRQRGFTLIELAIVLVVLAAVALVFPYFKALILTGESDNLGARLFAYQKAMSEFEDQYQHIPGDMPNPQSYLSGLGASDRGDGDGRLESNNAHGFDETRLFWKQLEASGLLTEQSLTVDPVTQYALGPKTETYVSVSQDQDQRIWLNYGRLSPSSVPEYAFMTPEEALQLDERLDDGIPDKGRVRGVDGTDAPGSCVAAGRYDVSVDYEACRLQIDLLGMQSQKASHEASTTVACGYVGESRPSSACPAGHVGQVLETCMQNGFWQESHRECVAVKCVRGGYFSEVRAFPCPAAFQGAMTARCMEGGVWGVQSNSCVPTIDGQPCTVNGTTRTFGCPDGQNGAIYYDCIGGVWAQNAASQCTPVNCSGVALAHSSISGCPSGYVGQEVYSCTLNGTSILSISNCSIAHGQGCSSEGSQRVQPCARGQLGQVLQECKPHSSGARWVTISRDCKPLRCGGELIGSYRATSQTCPAGTTGQVYEVCNDQGQWEAMESFCTRLRCSPESGGTDGNATWPWADAEDGVVVNGTCLSGFSGTPQRYCLSNGQWSGLLGGCI
jgi:prepilin-type N-terminal cleavage/methylation domain-containing protein